MGTTFILGAGFSAAQGFPLVRGLKQLVITFIKNELHPNYEACLTPGRDFKVGEFDDGLNHVDPTGTLGFEEVLIELRKALEHASSLDPCHRTDSALKAGCARLLWRKHESLHKLSSCYGAFAQRYFKETRENAVVSFNWDVLLERSLAEASVPWLYRVYGGVVPVLKPHGSINWSSYLNTSSSCGYSGWARIAPGSNISWDEVRPLQDPDPQEINPDLRSMLYPGDPELSRDNPDLGLIWSNVKRVLGERQSIVFIGYSLPEYDSYATQVFREFAATKNVSVYNPSPEALERFRSALGDKVHLCPQTFEQSPYGRAA
jgi:hypothetical protein